MKWESNNTLIHWGLKGMHWGIRRFQNEDGTLTPAGRDRYDIGEAESKTKKKHPEEYKKNAKQRYAYQNSDGSLTKEGRQHYIDTYSDAEKKADADIARAKNQLADIDKNGWNAKSAFQKSFVKQMKEDNLLNDEELEYCKEMFKDDLKKAIADKQAARSGLDFINKNQNATYDDILENSRKQDAQNGELDSYQKKAEELGKQLGLKKKKELADQARVNAEVTIKYDKNIEKQISKLPKDKKEKTYNDITKVLKQNGYENVLDQIKSYPKDQQLTILYTFMFGNYSAK